MEGVISHQQSSYHLGHASQSSDVDRDIYDAMRFYLSADLGLGDEVARARADQELLRKTAIAALDTISATGVSIAHTDVLDLGSGLGAVSEELVIRGARVIALEPGAAWASLTRRRVERHGGQFRLLEAFGEEVPLPATSVDLVVSLQVLEHVRDPKKVLAEVWRVLRPGGCFYLACENYLAFREPHYQVPWLPLMPKWLGGIYLRLLGRSPKFLNESITYTTYPGVLRECRRLGFSRYRDAEVVRNLRSKNDMKWTALRIFAALTGQRGPLWFDRSRYIFRSGLYELFHKPPV